MRGPSHVMPERMYGSGQAHNRVAVFASADFILSCLTRLLEDQRAVQLVVGDEVAKADVMLVAIDGMSSHGLLTLRGAVKIGEKPVVLVANELPKAAPSWIARYNIRAILPWHRVTGDALVSALGAVAQGGSAIPATLVGSLLTEFSTLIKQPHIPEMDPREVQVLRLMADGFDTAEIAVKLKYSERTVKNIVHRLTRRLNLRNRTHAVAHAFRNGFID